MDGLSTMEVIYVSTGYVAGVPETQRVLEMHGHRVMRWCGPEETLLADGPIIVDGTQDAVAAKRYCRDLATYRVANPVLAVIGVATLSDVSGQWRVSDFIVEGSSPVEIDARVVRAAASREAIAGASLRRTGDLVLDDAAMTLSDGNAVIALSHIEHELLKVFFDNPDLVLSRRALLNRVWQGDHRSSGRNIDTVICRMRRKLGARGYQIETVRGVGYRLSTDRAAELASA
jgi:DNA-binding response OmpR family regulator